MRSETRREQGADTKSEPRQRIAVDRYIQMIFRSPPGSKRTTRPVGLFSNMANPMKGLAKNSHLLVTVVFFTLLQGVSLGDQAIDWAVLSAPQFDRTSEGQDDHKWLRLFSLNHLRLSSLTI